MIKHIVLWKFKENAEGAPRATNLNKARLLLSELPSQIPGIVQYEIGKNVVPSDQAYDLALYAEFVDLAHLKAYQEHPAHRKVVEWLRRVHEGRAVVDYEAEAELEE